MKVLTTGRICKVESDLGNRLRGGQQSGYAWVHHDQLEGLGMRLCVLSFHEGSNQADGVSAC